MERDADKRIDEIGKKITRMEKELFNYMVSKEGLAMESRSGTRKLLGELIRDLHWDSILETEEDLAYIIRKLTLMMEEPIYMNPDLVGKELEETYEIIWQSITASATTEIDAKRRDIYLDVADRLELIFLPVQE